MDERTEMVLQFHEPAVEISTLVIGAATNEFDRRLVQGSVSVVDLSLAIDGQ